VVDDVPVLLNLIVGILKKANFSIIQAGGGVEALAKAGAHKGRIDLLLTDVQMPGVSGPDLGIALKQARPDMHVMLMSGLDRGDLLVLNYGWTFIQKPFIPIKLVELVRDVLSSPDKAQGSHQYDTHADEAEKKPA
jgi:two-component system cell cycle sensor histidine kinase/response regulator CckA